MSGLWTVLGLEPTRDVLAIQQAYEQKAQACRPGEDPEGFLELCRARENALAFAEGEESNPQEEYPAIQSFLELYTSKQRKDSKKWLDYFTSGLFLDTAWDGRFTARMLEHVNRLEEEYPVNREFLNWLCVAYQFSVTRAEYQNPDGSERVEFRFQINQGARFDGQQWVFEIATKGPTPKQLKGNELAMQYSFLEYSHLVRLAKSGEWREEEIGAFSQIVGCYAAGYITDKCQQRMDMDHERHPAGLRLLTHFLRREGLPGELYRIAWEKLDLKTAIMGRAKILYGAMRELALERLPELSDQKKVSFAQLRTDFHNYAVSTYKNNGENARADSGDIEKTDLFFAREDFQQALLDRRFVEEEMLRTWVTEAQCDYYLQRVIRFYEEHKTAPCAQRVIDRAREMMKYQAIASRLKKDREAKILEGTITLKSSPFFRHWINTGFYHAKDRTSGQELLTYLTRELPYLPEWSKKFLNEKPGKKGSSQLAAYMLGEDRVEVRFHLHYIEFLLNGKPVYRPCLSWRRVIEWTDTDAFFFLLPITVGEYGQYADVKGEILRRLSDTAAPEDIREVIAGCLAGQVCILPPPNAVELSPEFDGEKGRGQVVSLPPENVLPFEIFAENEDSLYVCVWFQQEEALALYRQTPYGRQMVRNEYYEGITDAESAVSEARRLLQEYLSPVGLPMAELKTLPDAVYAKPDFHVVCMDKDAPPLWSRPVELLGEDVSVQALEELLDRFSTGRIDRLELSWKAAIPKGEEQDYESCRSLVFLKSGGRYACLYFDDFRAESYALLERPELYGKEDSRPERVPFRQGRLFQDVIHRNFTTIRRHLDIMFGQVSWPNNVKYMAGGIWSYAENVSHGRTKYNLDKQLLADFPMERSHNRSEAPFYFAFPPNAAALVDGQGGVEGLEVNEGNRLCLQQMLGRFFKEGFSQIRLTWGREPDHKRHIVLLQDGGRFLMAWVLEEERKVRFHVADTWTYMDVEGKKYPKDTFQNRVTPAYLIHDGIKPVRNALDLLLAKLDSPEIITNKMAEYAEEKPVKARPYDALWSELVGSTL